MYRRRIIILCVLACCISGVSGQGYTVQVRDTVRIPSGRSATSADMTVLLFEEIWSVYPSRPALHKEVTGYRALEPGHGMVEWLGNQYKGWITYEYELRDPQTGKEDGAFGPVRELVERNAPLARNYDLGTQLISVRFDEEWSYDTLSHELAIEVKTITPVIWQRRQTSEGEPVDDGETGLPVYYKLELESIRLRNP